MKTFSEKVKDAVGKIPHGETLTYAEVARRAGNPQAYRAVGNILNKNHNPKIPCHRVIRSDGTAGGYNRGTEEKENILRREGAIL
jgi:O-6-methylguanine DNA methyltransferase